MDGTTAPPNCLTGITMPTWPVRFDGAPPPVKPAPLLGQHTVEVLDDWLGLGSADVEALHRDGIV